MQNYRFVLERKNMKKKLIYFFIIICLIICSIFYAIYNNKTKYYLTNENIDFIISHAVEEKIFPNIKDENYIQILSVSKDWKKEDAVYFTYQTENDENAFILIESKKQTNNEFYLYVYESNSYISWQKEKTNIYKLNIKGDNCYFEFIESIPISFKNGSLKISNSNIEMVNMNTINEEEYKYSIKNRYNKK